MNIKRILTIFAIFAGLACAHPAQAASVAEIKTMIVTQAVELGIDPALALSLAKVESNFRQEARSKVGAVGIYQLMPSTARKIGVNPYTIQGNIKGGLKYYLMMYKMFGSTDLALAAYNAGPGNVKKFNAIPPYAETQRFVQKIKVQRVAHKNDPAILQAKAPKPVLEKNVPVPESVNSISTPVDIEQQKRNSIIIQFIDNEVMAI